MKRITLGVREPINLLIRDGFSAKPGVGAGEHPSG
ncbi:protein of unknown function (plasmid) [Shinella sp. WSC3-e]|nr:protein of unknown function [Shinella sp. WSC3-e]